MWKILTAQMREEIHYSLISRRLFPEEQNGCGKGTRETPELIYTDQYIFKESKTWRKNLAMTWIDYRKAYDMIPHKISGEVIKFIKNTMENWRVELTAGGKSLAEVKTICYSDDASESNT